MTRLSNLIAICIFSIIFSFSILMATAGMLNTVRKVDYRMWQAKQEMEEVLWTSPQK